MLRSILAEVFAALIYFPLARGAALGERFRAQVGTRLEHRTTKAEIAAMMERCGLSDNRFSNAVPFWCAAGIKR